MWISGVPELPNLMGGDEIGFFNALFSFDVAPGIQIATFFYGVSRAAKYECDENVFAIMYLIFQNGEYRGRSGPFIIGGCSAFLNGNPLKHEMDPDGYLFAPMSHWPDFREASYDPVDSPAWIVVPRVLLYDAGDGRSQEVVIWRRYFQSKTWRNNRADAENSALNRIISAFQFVKEDVMIQPFDKETMAFDSPRSSPGLKIVSQDLWNDSPGPRTCEARFHLVAPVSSAINPAVEDDLKDPE